MFHTFYQLREQPFGVNPDPRFLYLSKTHREAFSSLLYRIQIDSGFLAMIAQPGMGKTTLLFHLLHQLQPTARTAFIFQTQCTSHELLQYLLSEFECDTSITDTVRMSQELKSLLLAEANAGRRCVLLIDEAQNLEPEVLETVRLLSDFETPRRKLLQIILCGQSELGEKLAHPGLQQLRQRLSSIVHIHRFTPEETTLYIAHRLKIAGYTGKVSQLFDFRALTRIAQLSEGTPRVINNICFNALSLGFALEKKQIGLSIIEEVACDLGLARTPLSVHVESDESGAASFENSPPGFAVGSCEQEAQPPATAAVFASPAAVPKSVLASDSKKEAELEANPSLLVKVVPLQARVHAARRSLNRSFLVLGCACTLVLWVAPATNVPTRGEVAPQKAESSVGEILLPSRNLHTPPAKDTSAAAAPAPQPRPAEVASPASPEPHRAARLMNKTGSHGETPSERMPWKARQTSGAPVDLAPASFDSDQLLALLPLNSLPIAARAIPAPAPPSISAKSDAPASPSAPMGGVSEASYRPPKPLLRPAPAYPEIALQSSVAGDVVLLLSVSSKGDVYKVKVLNGSNFLVEAAENGVKRWKYSPAMSNGSPVKSEILETLRFRLR